MQLAFVACLLLLFIAHACARSSDDTTIDFTGLRKWCDKTRQECRYDDTKCDTKECIISHRVGYSSDEECRQASINTCKDHRAFFRDSCSAAANLCTPLELLFITCSRNRCYQEDIDNLVQAYDAFPECTSRSACVNARSAFMEFVENNMRTRTSVTYELARVNSTHNKILDILARYDNDVY